MISAINYQKIIAKLKDITVTSWSDKTSDVELADEKKTSDRNFHPDISYSIILPYTIPHIMDYV